MIFATEKRAAKESSAGFTLLEVLVAVAILGMAYLVILQNFSLSLQNISRLERNAMRLLSVQIEMDKHFIFEDIDQEEPAGEIFVEDTKYKVLLVASEEDERLVTLVIKKQ